MLASCPSLESKQDTVSLETATGARRSLKRMLNSQEIAIPQGNGGLQIVYKAASSPPPSPFYFRIEREGASARRSLDLLVARPDFRDAKPMREGLVFPRARPSGQ